MSRSGHLIRSARENTGVSLGIRPLAPLAALFVVLAVLLLPATTLAQSAPEVVSPGQETASGAMIEGQPLDQVEDWRLTGVPAELQAWVPWALRDQAAALGCTPALAAGAALDPVCAWPGPLVLSIEREAMSFRQPWTLLERGWLPLPGQRGAWPTEVTLDGAPATVVDRDGRPFLFLDGPRASARVEGEIAWLRRPTQLSIPEQVGVVLAADGTPLRLDDNGDLWLQRPREATPAAPQDSLSIKVFRRFTDGNPMVVVTRLLISVTGRERSLTFADFLPEGFVPHQVESALPVGIDQAGRLEIQVGQGSHSVDVLAHATGDILSIPVPDVAGEGWPGRELWSFQVVPALRSLGFTGLDQIDPSQTEIPEPWRGDRAFLAEAGKAGSLDVQLLADIGSGVGRVDLRREAWLDFSGRGLTFRDSITGELFAPGRFSSPLDIGRLELNGTPWVLSEIAADDAAASLDGIEVPAGRLALTAEGRLETDPEQSGTFPLRLASNGWVAESAVFDSVNTTINLPAGWLAVAAFGTDNLPRTWLTKWNLLDLFLLILVAALFVKALGLWAGVLWVIVGALTWQLPFGGGSLWIAVILLGILTRACYQRDIPRLGNLVGGIAAALFVVLAVFVASYTVYAVKTSLFPQLDRNFANRYDAALSSPNRAMGLAEAEMAMPSSAPMRGKAAAPSDYLGLDQDGGRLQVIVDAEAKIGTGPGLPTWRGNQTTLAWQVPNVPDAFESASLYLLTPMMFGAAKLIGAGGLIVLLVALAFRGYRTYRDRPVASDEEAMTLDVGAARSSSPAVALIAVAVLSSPALFVSDEALAQSVGYPSDTLIEELRSHVLRSPECAPNCASSGDMRVVISRAEDQQGWTLRLLLDVSALHETAYPLPARRSEWQPRAVLLDGETTPVRADGASRIRYVRMPAGRHSLELSGAIPPGGLTLTLNAPPQRIRVEAPDVWRVDGVSALGLSNGSLSIAPRQRAEAGDASAPDTAGLEPFTRVLRTISFGPKWTVSTRVQRLSSSSDSAVVLVPLLDGERVVSSGLSVRDGRIEIPFRAGQTERRWTSELEFADRIRLESPGGGAFSETWTIAESPLWRVEAVEDEGVATLQQGALRTWRPWPGQRIELNVTRPKPVPAATMTVRASTLTVMPRAKGSRYTLEVSIQSSQGDVLPIRLAAGSRFEALEVDGSRRHVRETALEDGRVELQVPIDPGLHRVLVSWDSAAAIATRYRVAPVELGVTAATNLSVKVMPAEDRWVVWTAGPSMGPAVTFWALLIAVVVAALVFGAIRGIPLKRLDWFVLLVGLTQSLLAAVVVVVWVLAFHARGWLSPKASAWRHNLVQLVLALLTVAAFATLLDSIPSSLLGQPEMHIAGNGSSADALQWYQDRVEGEAWVALPQPELISAWVIVYRALMLLWALLVVRLVVRLASWAWARFVAPVAFKPIGGGARRVRPKV
ncbi:MAG: hypothetical protein J7D61_12140 [Marichromatium sp.]|nr:hypothetical protein [Marichromatium sp.]